MEVNPQEQDEAERRSRYERRDAWEAWRLIFLSALAGTASSGELIVKLVDRAAEIADKAVPIVMARRPPNP